MEATGKEEVMYQRTAPFTLLIFLMTLTLLLPRNAIAVDYTYSANPSSHSWTQISDNSYTMDTDNDGHPDVTLTKNGNEWTYEFSVEDDERDYYVYEQMMSTLSGQGYTSSGSDGATVIAQDPGKTSNKTYTITNTKSHSSEPQTGSLQVTKTVSSGTETVTRKFAFTIQLSSTNSTISNEIKGTKIFSDIPFVDGKATISLANGEEKTISGLPANVSYTVTETSVDGYTTTQTGDTGTITANQTKTAAFTNTKENTKDETKTVPLTITKKVENKLDDGQEFSFHVILTNLGSNSEYDKGDGTKFLTDANGEADIEITLKDGESFTIPSLPVGSNYRVTEAGGDYTIRYDITDSASAGNIRQNLGQASTNEDLTTAEETAEEGEVITITYTNKIVKTQTLILKKVVTDLAGNATTGDNDADGKPNKYQIRIQFSGMDPSSSFDSSIGGITADDNGDVDMYVYLTNGESITFTNVPIGTKYRFTEMANDKSPSYKIEADHGTFVKESASAGATNQELRTGTSDDDRLGDGDETVDVYEDATVTFTNTPPAPINLAQAGSDGRIVTVIIIGVAIATLTAIRLVSMKRNQKESK